MNFLNSVDPELNAHLISESQRQQDGLEMIASENYTSPAVMERPPAASLQTSTPRVIQAADTTAVANLLTRSRTLPRDRAMELFGAEFANVQPHSGSQANQAVYLTSAWSQAIRVLGFDLAHGGHLTHGMHSESFRQALRLSITTV